MLTCLLWACVAMELGRAGGLCKFSSSQGHFSLARSVMWKFQVQVGSETQALKLQLGPLFCPTKWEQGGLTEGAGSVSKIKNRG